VESEAYREEAIEYRHETVDGSYLWVESVASANPTPDRQYVINTRDISERREREQQLRRMNERLDEFASVVSHDLQNPLSVASARLELAEEDCDSEHIDDAMAAVDRGLQLVDSLGSLASMGSDDMEKEDVPLETAVGRSWRTIETNNAHLENDADRSVYANPSRLGQVLENVLGNAVEHGGDEVTITVGNLPAGFYIADDGPGIPEEKRSLVFEIGYSTDPDGTGFGLGIVKRIVENNGWDITLTESQAGGTRFEISGIGTVE
jgi:signal transduction histidine kinase